MTQTIIETRGAQMFPHLTHEEIERVERFGERRSWAQGEYLARVGEMAPGLVIVLSGKVDVFQNKAGHRSLIVTHTPGTFMGELAQLGGRPALVDAIAAEPVEAIVIPPTQLRAVLVAEAELGEIIMRSLILRRMGLIETGGGGPVIVGRADDGNVLRLENFLRRNGHPHQHLDPIEDACGKVLIERFSVEPEELPIVVCPNGKVLRNPTEFEVARCVGLISPLDPDQMHDVLVVGAGPAGLAAAVYAASEGLSVAVLDCRAFGGQAGASARIENYLGFPTGVTGMALMGRAYNQAIKFGADIVIPCEANRIDANGAAPFAVNLASGERVRGRAIVLACGARYRRLDVPNLCDFEMTSVHYWASPLEANLCQRQEVALVGAGNSAGQATVFLASKAKKVWLIARGGGLEATMSRYLVDRIRGLPNVEVLTRAEVTALEGSDGRLDAIRLRCDGRDERCDKIRHLFLFIGAEPNTDWLAGSGIELDGKGFVVTGADLNGSTHGAGRKPMETSRRGIFAIGDVRCGSVKRVAAAVGEGAQVVAALHAYLAEVAPADAVHA